MNRRVSIGMSIALAVVVFHRAMPDLLASDSTTPAGVRAVQRPVAPGTIEQLGSAGDDLFLVSLADSTASGQVGTTNLDVSVESGESNAITVAPGSLVEYQVVGLLSDDNNQGLALVGFDLDFSGGDLSQADTPTGDPESGCENPMIHFTEPWGLTNPAGFGGTVIGGDLIQIGGAQNTINNTPDHAPFPIGTTLLGVARPSGCGLAVLVTGSLNAPSTLGTYTLALENLFANVIIADTTGDPIWQTQAAGVGTVVNLIISVVGAPVAEGACCLQLSGGCTTMTAPACGALGGTYRGNDSTCGADPDTDGVTDACDHCPESSVAGTIVIDDCDSGVQNRPLADGCLMLDRIEQCGTRPSRPFRFARCVTALVDQWRTDAFITGDESDRILRCCLTTRK